MNTPKLLPWYARKAGVSEERATELWRDAVRQATNDTGWVGNSEYYGAAMSTFQQLLEQERQHAYQSNVVPLIRSQVRLMQLPLTAMEAMLEASSHWYRNHCRNQNAA
jgi:hypothetical protein